MNSLTILLVVSCAVLAFCDEEKTVEKRAIIYTSYDYPYYGSYVPYISPVFKRDTAAVEENVETEKNVEKRAVLVGSPFVYPYANYWPYYGIVKREAEQSNEHVVQKRNVNQEDEKSVGKRSILFGSYFYSYSSYPYVHTLFKRDTAAAENTEDVKNVDKRSILIGSVPYPSSFYTWPYGIVKRETEESNVHSLRKREVGNDNPHTQKKRELLLSYGYPYYGLYDYPALHYLF